MQCKAESRKIGPATVRELEGVTGYESRTGLEMERAYREEVGVEDDDETNLKKRRRSTPPPPTIAILVSSSGFSKEAVLRAFSSRIPLSLITLAARGDLSSDQSTRSLGNEGIKYECDGLSVNPALRKLLGDALDVRRLRKTESVAEEGEGGAGAVRTEEIEIRWDSEGDNWKGVVL